MKTLIILTRPTLTLFCMLFLSMLTLGQESKPPGFSGNSRDEKIENTALPEQIISIKNLRDQILSESHQDLKDPELLRLYTSDIETLNALILFLESGREAAQFPGCSADHTLSLRSPASIVPGGKDRSLVTYFGDEVVHLPGLTIKRLKE